MSKQACIYCKTGAGSTRDHVPPRGFFEDPVPNNAQLITVPCCESCRKRDEANDELVRNILTSLKDTEPLPYVSKHVAPRRDRSMRRSRSQILKIKGMMQRVALKDERGNVIGEDWAFSLDHPSITQFLERIGRALLFEEFGQRFFEADFGLRVNLPIPAEIYQFVVANFPKRNILDVLTYSIWPEKEREYWIIVQFYGRIEFFLCFKKEADPATTELN